MQRRAMIRTLLAAPLAPALLAGLGRAAEPAAVPVPEALLEGIRRVYSEAKTYRDTGVVTTTFFKLDREVMMVSKKPFSTAFVRPDRFRYEYSETRGDERPSRYLIARDAAGTVRTWWDVRPGVKTGGSLTMALAGATGVSDGSANTVPSLLLRDERGGGNWTMGKDLVLLDDAETAGRRCHRIRSTISGHRLPLPEGPMELRGTDADVRKVLSSWKGTVFTYWVDAESLLLRRVESAADFSDFHTEAITTYEPALNEDVPDSALVFDPPGA